MLFAKVRLGTFAMKTGGRVSKSTEPKSPQKGRKNPPRSVDEVLAYWEDQDRKSLPFANFLRIVVWFQIQKNLTDKATAFELGLDQKTYLSWRASIAFASVLRELLKTISNTHDKPLSVAMSRLQTQLRKQIRGIKRQLIPEHRSHAGMPTKGAFSRVLDQSVGDVLSYWVAKEELTDDGNYSNVARKIADGFAWSFAYEPTRNVASAYDVLILRTKELASIVSEIALLRVISSPTFEWASDALILQRQVDLEGKRAQASKSANAAAQSYLEAIIVGALEGDKWSELSAGRYPVLTVRVVNEEAGKYDLDRMLQIIDSIERVAGSSSSSSSSSSSR